MNAISKPDVILEHVEDVKIVIEPIPVVSILTKSNRFYAWMDRWTELSYQAWEKAGALVRQQAQRSSGCLPRPSRRPTLHPRPPLPLLPRGVSASPEVGLAKMYSGLKTYSAFDSRFRITLPQHFNFLTCILPRFVSAIRLILASAVQCLTMSPLNLLQIPPTGLNFADDPGT